VNENENAIVSGSANAMGSVNESANVNANVNGSVNESVAFTLQENNFIFITTEKIKA
jgi:hypothetical protein